MDFLSVEPKRPGEEAEKHANALNKMAQVAHHRPPAHRQQVLASIAARLRATAGCCLSHPPCVRFAAAQCCALRWHLRWRRCRGRGHHPARWGFGFDRSGLVSLPRPACGGSFWQLWSRVVAGMPPAHGSSGAGHLQAGRAKHGGESGVAFVAACGSLRLPCVCALVLRCSKKCTCLTVCVRRVLAGLCESDAPPHCQNAAGHGGMRGVA